MKDIQNLDFTTVVQQAKEIDVTDLNGEKVMMDLDRGQYFALNEVGSRIWEMIQVPLTVSELVSMLLLEYKTDTLTCQKAVIEFLGRMNDAKLIRIV